MRERKSYVPPFELAKALEGGCVGKVVESKNNQFAIGDYVLGMKGWRDTPGPRFYKMMSIRASLQRDN